MRFEPPGSPPDWGLARTLTSRFRKSTSPFAGANLPIARTNLPIHFVNLPIAQVHLPIRGMGRWNARARPFRRRPTPPRLCRPRSDSLASLRDTPTMEPRPVQPQSLGSVRTRRGWRRLWYHRIVRFPLAFYPIAFCDCSVPVLRGHLTWLLWPSRPRTPPPARPPLAGGRPSRPPDGSSPPDSGVREPRRPFPRRPQAGEGLPTAL